MVTVAMRDAPVILASTRNMTRPLPLPDWVVLMTSHKALLVAVHAQPVPAVTSTEALLVPDASNVSGDDETDTWHVAPADCVMETDVPAIVTTAERGDVLVFGAAVSV
jgi:hypothetical protein